MKNRAAKFKRYLNLLEDERWTDIVPIREIGVCPCDYKTDNTPPPLSDFQPYHNGDSWGSGRDSHAWFHFKVERGDRRRDLPFYLFVSCDHSIRWLSDLQLLLYVNGEARQGFDRNHQEYLLGDGDSFDIYLYAYIGMNMDTSRLCIDTRFLQADVDGLYYDILYPIEMLDFLGNETGEYAKVATYMDDAFSMLALYDVGSEDFLSSVRAARAFLAEEFYGKYCQKQPATVVGIGHTHIDCAWLWTLRQTREKVQRSFATVLELMRLYPEYKFMSSQVYLYRALKEEAPELYKEVIERIREKRWECEGAMWVEADCNLTSGESLVRQLLYGKDFFRREFGVDNHVLWLPDVFGYSAALPQILRKCGVDWFVTSKISWNETNRMPYDTFRWRGIDGTEINTYFLTAREDRGQPTGITASYNGCTSSRMINGTYKRYQQKDLSDEVLLTYGYGDGGGGPTRTYLELLRRGKNGIPGVPNAEPGFAGDFLDRLSEKMKHSSRVPTWNGELYLEFHRGTYTSQARNKKNNRRAEMLYQNAELLSTIAAALGKVPFPQEELHRGWEMILTNQFHDIIPGSSIREVYEQCEKDYPVIHGIGKQACENAKTAIASSLAKNHGYVVFNPHSFSGMRGIVKLDGESVYTDVTASKGYYMTDRFVKGNRVKIDGHTVETDALRVEFNDAWQIVSLFDKKNAREVLKAGAIGNELRIHADYPEQYDNWEWKEYSRDQYRTLTEVSSVETVEDGVRRGIRVKRPHMHSTVTQTMWFTDASTEIIFETEVDWHEHHQMLKAAFPVEINATAATYEIQFGTVSRPTHENTSWDAAKFEVCAHKYADLSEGNYGVSLLNDCKYGHDIHDGVMQLSLLRCGTNPDPQADQGVTSFTYALYPHAGTLAEADTAILAYYLNEPLTAIPAAGENDTVPVSYSAVTTDHENVICETVKQAEHGDGTILRFYESQNKRDTVTIKTDLPFEKAYLCDLLENEIGELDAKDGALSLDVHGFEIVTVKLK